MRERILWKFYRLMTGTGRKKQSSDDKRRERNISMFTKWNDDKVKWKRKLFMLRLSVITNTVCDRTLVTVNFNSVAINKSNDIKVVMWKQQWEEKKLLWLVWKCKWNREKFYSAKISWILKLIRKFAEDSYTNLLVNFYLMILYHVQTLLVLHKTRP